jgi:pentatricopeptide repeat protein
MLYVSFLALALVLMQVDPFYAFVSSHHSSLSTNSVINQPGRLSSTTTVSSATLSQSNAIDLNGNEKRAASIEDLTSKFLSEGFDDEGATDVVLPILHFWSKRESVAGAETVQEILDRLEEQVDSGEISNSNLHCGHYAIAVDAWAKSGDNDSSRKADAVVNRMHERGVKLNRVVYNSWMNAHAIQKNTTRVKEILSIMENDIPEEILVKDYNILISSLAKQGRPMEAENNVKSLVERYNKGEAACLPDLISYNLILDAWAKSGGTGCGTRADVRPDQRSYVAAMSAVIRSGEENVIDRVERIRKKAKSRGIDDDAYVFSTLLDAYATAGPNGSRTKVEEILGELEKIDTTMDDRIVVYNTALKLFKESQDKDAPSHAEELFQRMKSQGAVDQVSYGTLITIYANQKGDSSARARVESLLKDMHETCLKPTTLVMNSVMNMWVRSGELNKAKDILDQMEEAYNNGSYELAPSVVSYTTLMNGWAKSKDARKVEKTEEVFERMRSMCNAGNEEAQPNLFSYVILVESIVRSGQPNAAERAEKVVRDLYNDYKRGLSAVKPNAQIISTVMNCWGRSGDRSAGERAEILLDWLIDVYEKEKDKSLQPNEFTFSSGK